MARQGSWGPAPLGAERPGGDLSHRHDGHRAWTDRQFGFKDHWHRPRPIQTQDFNGPDPFTPWYDDDGACEKNCSFVSGEAATGFWMVAPASVLPPPWRGPAIVAAFAFGFGAGLLRLAFGGHYLSDVLLGGLITLIVIEVVRRLVWPLGASEPESLRQVKDRGLRRRDASSARGASL